jgi:hypothetical protein
LTRTHSLFFLVTLSLVSALMACHEERRTNKAARVYVDQQEGRYTLMRDGKPFAVKGAGGFSHFQELEEAGGNTLRTWDTTGLAAILDSAGRHHLAVIVGLPLPNSSDLALYESPESNQKRLQAFTSLVRRYKSHPSVLMWCLGNELDFPYKWKYADFYKAFNDLTDMIHTEDPDHPVTTTILNFNSKYIFNLRLRCNIDIISFNIFGRLSSLRQDLADLAWFWKGPYMLLEWGVSGPWQGTEQTAWSAFIEDTSQKKAEVYRQRYRRDMPVEDPRFLGACVFFWGNKQETTPTWFSMFDEDGRSSEAVGIMRELWTGRPSPVTYPQIRYMLLSRRGARDNVLLTPGAETGAEVRLSNRHSQIRSVRWQVFREDWYRENHRNSTRKLTPLMTVTAAGDSLRLTFSAPREEGPYRIFATVYDQGGHFSSCNTPFYVIRQP